jgi:DNA-binding MarR family transcriptional regulator
MTPTALFNSMMLTSGAITHRIDRLEMLGLVQRVPDPDDRRSILVGLTKKGLAVIDRAIGGHLANESAILSQLTRNEQRLLADLLRKLVLALAGETRTPTRPGEAETVRNPRRVTPRPRS